MRRLIPLVTDEIYHIYSKSIYGFKIFNKPREYQRMLYSLQFNKWPELKDLSQFLNSNNIKKFGFNDSLKLFTIDKKPSVQIIAYCLMPTHIHLVLKQLVDNGIQKFMTRTLGGYTLYFNKLHNRKGPLWQSRFGNTHVDSERLFLKEINYVHSNPFKDLKKLKDPYSWKYSSLNEYLICEQKICQWNNLLPFEAKDYQKVFKEYLKTI